MIATAALLPVLDDEWHVHLERGFRGIANLKGRKCDLVLQSVRDPPISYYLEFKTVWPGSDEGIDGAHDDVLKLRNLPAGDHERAYIVLFAYALEKSPKEARYGSVGTLSELVEKAKRKLGAPGFTSDLLQLDELGARAQAQLLAWRVDSIVDQG
jgi:hypothetical protein